LQARIIDGGGIGSIASVNVSFILPLICFIVIVLYGHFVTKLNKQ
jgi:FHS family L-fucose permease-like MFS transporter